MVDGGAGLGDRRRVTGEGKGCVVDHSTTKATGAILRIGLHGLYGWCYRMDVDTLHPASSISLPFQKFAAVYFRDLLTKSAIALFPNLFLRAFVSSWLSLIPDLGILLHYSTVEQSRMAFPEMGKEGDNQADFAEISSHSAICPWARELSFL